ncbi:MAG: hypothetical protein FJ171_05815 [Gammaproteobacteria bacterium]|nr:hypothetical protein [Gammaproteobacteria bacterium]
MNPSFALLLAGLLAAPLAAADQLPLFQVGMNGGYRMGGGLEDSDTGADRDFEDDSSFALALELRYDKGDDRFYQLWYSRQATEVDDGTGGFDADIEYLHIGGTLPFGGWEHAQPYFAAGIGATRFSGSMAFGLEIPLATHAAVRLEARGYLTAVDTSTSFFCRSDGGEGVCRIVASGSAILQSEALAGILVRF